MVKNLGKVTTLTGKSGIKYEFKLWSFDVFDDVKRSFAGGGLYLFTKRFVKDGEYWHTYIYLGETSDYFTRFDGHHKEVEISDYESNCVGFYPMPNSSDIERKSAEEDLLNSYRFPCNSTNNN